MELMPTGIDDLLLIVPRIFEDERGTFMETWNRRTFSDAGIDADFVQDNHSRSARGVLRGLHYQQPGPQGKLVRVSAGRAWDVAVDLRRGSATYGHWFGAELSASNRHMLWIPAGFAHGFLSLEDDTDVLYKCTAFHDPAGQHALRWDDPDLAIAWPATGLPPRLSAKDAAAKPLSQVEPLG